MIRQLLLPLLLALAPSTVLLAQSVPPDATWIPIEGSNTLIATWTRDGTPFQALSRDGGSSIVDVRRSDLFLHVRYASFDPLISVPRIPAMLRARTESGLQIIQLVARPLPEMRDYLQSQGVEIVHFLAAQGLVVRAGRGVLARIKALPWVRWTGPWHKAYRMDEAMLAEVQAGLPVVRWYNVQVTRRGLSEKQEVREHVLALGGEADAPYPGGRLLRARLDPAQLLDVLERDDVFFVDRWSPPEVDVDIARQLGGADWVEGVLGYTGHGVRGEVMDSGLLTTHPNYQTHPPIIHTGNGTSPGHGTSVYGIVFGDGVGSATARGLLPDAQGIFAGYQVLGNRWNHTAELVDPNNIYRAVFQTNSWGNARTTQYTTISADMDDLLFDHDIVITQSQSNAGNQDSRPQAWAKNIVSVGGFRHQNTLTTTDDCWNCGSSAASIGPAADGRIKPDVSFFYDNIRTTSSSGGYTNGFGGTSGATPLTAGHVGLIMQMWAGGLFGNPTPGADVFENRPHMTTAKALLLAGASQYPFSGANADMTRVHQGWGRPNVRTLVEHATRMFVVNETDLLADLASVSYTLEIAAGEPELRTCMIYADPAGNPGSAIHRINDLSLKVTAPDGTLYWGNNGLLTGTTSTPGGSANTIDTVEQVIVSSPQAGLWTFEVIASEVNQDSHVETPQDDADFALVVLGARQPGLLTPAGQANALDAALIVSRGQNVNGFPALDGVGGPFFAGLPGGAELELTFRGPQNAPFVLLAGPINPGNILLPGIGSLDLGLLGPGIGDVSFIMDGTSGVGFLNALANVGPAGMQIMRFGVPALPPGVLGSLQAVLIDPTSGSVALTGACEITVN